MSLLQTVILAIIEGITEFLPISSTGHMILASKLLQIAPTEFSKSFEIFIQLGAILAVVWLYKDQLVTSIKFWPKIIFGFIPSAVAGFLFYPFIKNYLLQSSTVVVISLALGGLLLIVVEHLHKEKTHNLASLGLKTAFMIGIFQALSIVPGVSRAAATIIGGLLLGLNRKSAVEFSFLLAIPTMFAATGWDLLQSNQDFSSEQLKLLLVGFIVSFATAMVAIKFLLSYIKNHNFKAFGIYRIVLAGLFSLFG